MVDRADSFSGSRIVVASRNPAKVREIRRVIEGLPVEVMDLAQAGFDAEIEETGQTFAENAAAKALAVAEATGELALADDSGLMVDALGGRPGVLSARYGGDDLTDSQRVELLLRELAQVPHARRAAQFVCVLALAVPGRILARWAGRVCGVIADKPQGTGGFGYDPVFLYLPAGRTFAQMTPDEKNAVSHRGRAIRRLPEVLRRLSEADWPH